MFLSKHKNGYYYIYYKDNVGKRKAISTKSENKTDANKSLSDLSAELKERAEKKTVPISLKKMIFEFLKYSESVHSYNHTLSLKSTLKEMVNYIGDVPAEQIDKKS